MKNFIHNCELPEEIFDLAKEKGNNSFTYYIYIIIVEVGHWSEYKENYYNSLG